MKNEIVLAGKLIEIIEASRNNALRKVNAMSRTLSPMMVAEYKLQLPDKAVLQKKLQELINMPLIEE